MKLIIDIDEELYAAYKGKPPMLGDAGMDMIAQAIANGTPIKSVAGAKEVKDLPLCKECRTCIHCMLGKKKLPKIVWMNGNPFIFCARHHEHFAPNDTCEFWRGDAVE